MNEILCHDKHGIAILKKWFIGRDWFELDSLSIRFNIEVLEHRYYLANKNRPNSVIVKYGESGEMNDLITVDCFYVK